MTPVETPLETPLETPSPRSEASRRCSEERALPDEGGRLGLFDFPHTVVASFLEHGDIVRNTYVSTAAKASYYCENDRLLCPWLVYSKETKADAEELVKRISLANVLAVRFIGTRLGGACEPPVLDHHEPQGQLRWFGWRDCIREKPREEPGSEGSEFA